ncbi:MAG TPA: GAF domain-containing protein [Bradyrhizobium sp.]|jgi:GAF domain-containing protein
MTAPSPEVVANLRLENARLLTELHAVRDRQTASAEILRTIAGTSGDAERALQQIAETTAHLIGASSVTLRIASGAEWSRTINVGASAKRIGSEIPAAQLRIGARNLPGTVLLENRQIHIPDINNVDPAITDWPGLPPARAAGTRAMAGTPLRREGKAIGVLIVHRDRPVPFTDEELALLQGFADQAVIAIENARLFNETREALDRQTATAEILKVIASSPSDVQPVFEAIAESAKRLAGGHSATVTRAIGDMIHLAAFTAGSEAGNKELRSSFPTPLSSSGIHSRVARTGKLAFRTDIETEPDVPQGVKELARARGYRSILVVPMLREGVSIGTIGITRRDPGPFADNVIDLLNTFADQAVIAIENTRLFNETREALERQTATAEILKVIASSPSDAQPVFDVIVERAVRLCGGRMGRVYRYDGGVIQMVAGHGLSAPGLGKVQQVFPRPATDDTIVGQVMLSRRPYILPDIKEDETVPALSRQMIEALGTRSQVTMPMLLADEPIGAITVGWADPGAYKDQQITLLQTFADQAVIAIENVRLFNETREALERQTATADILKVIASSPSDVQPVFEAIATSANRLIGGYSTAVLRFIDDELHLAAFTPTNATADEALKASFPRPLAEFPPFELVRNGEIIQFVDTEFEDVPRLIRDLARLRGYRSMLFTPLMNGETPIGLISVTRKEPGNFAAHHIQLVRTFADQAVIAIENVRLFDEVQAKTRDLTEALTYQTGSSNILSVIASSPTDVGPVLKAIVESASELCDAYDSVVLLKDGDDLRFSAHHGPIPINLEKWPINRDWAAGRAFVDQKPVHVHDLLSDSGADFPDARELSQHAGSKGIRSILSVPLLRENESIGAILLRRTEVHAFSDKQIALLQTFADQAVIAIGNVRLFEEVQERTRDLSKSLDDLRTAQDRLVQTQKLASLGQLTAGIAHEIKNPLNFVNNFSALSAELTDELNEVLKPAALSDTIREEVDELTAMLKDNLEKVVQHGKRADSIVKNMLLHSREGSGEHRPADINALLDESLNLAYHGARAEKREFNVTLQRDFDAMAGTIEVFPQEITRVFLNLISNGFYAVTKRKTENGNSGFDPVLRATTRNLGDTVEIRIRDNGIGIPAEVKEKMFNPFFTTKPAGEGTGLGLSMSHDIIVKQHGGTIEVETEPGQFTEFTIVLPRTSIHSNKIRGQT